MTLRNILIAAMSAAVLAGGATAALADTPWQQHHPRREQVNNRLNHSIRDERGEGGVSGYQAWRLHQRAHFIRSQERYFARHNDGHITRGEQARLNHEENHLRHHIPG